MTPDRANQTVNDIYDHIEKLTGARPSEAHRARHESWLRGETYPYPRPKVEDAAPDWLLSLILAAAAALLVGGMIAFASVFVGLIGPFTVVLCALMFGGLWWVVHLAVRGRV